MFEKIPRLAERNIFIGTSSWKYTGWRGLIYKGEYPSEKAFNNSCLEEYTKFFSAVGIDHTYYAWPNPSTFERYLEQTPEQFRFGLKATEKLTVYRYPNIKRYGKEAGKDNEDFLNADLFLHSFLKPLEPFLSRMGPIMFEFSKFHPGTIGRGSEFVERLNQFFHSIRRETDHPLAVEIRNSNWLKPAYFNVLQENRVGHVHNGWTEMPSIAEQLESGLNHSLPLFACRVLLQKGTKYQTAVDTFSPYDRIQSASESLRDDTALLIQTALEKGIPAYVFVNNRAEGCAPMTISAVLERIDI